MSASMYVCKEKGKHARNDVQHCGEGCIYVCKLHIHEQKKSVLAGGWWCARVEMTAWHGWACKGGVGLVLMTDQVHCVLTMTCLCHLTKTMRWLHTHKLFLHTTKNYIQ